MIHTIRAELIKVRTVLVHWILALVAIAFPIVISGLNAALADLFRDESNSVSELISGLSVVTGMLLGAVAVITLTSEYSHNTIRPTYAATPHRTKVLGSKLLVNSVLAFVVTALGVAASWIVASIIRSGRDFPISLSDDGVLRPMIVVCLLAVVITWFGFGLGLIIRNSPATVTVFLLWPLLIEGLIAGLFVVAGWDSAPKWLPYQAGIGALSNDNTEDVIGWPGGLLWFAAVSLGLIALGVFLDHRRDA